MAIRKKVSDGNGGTIEVREDVALIVQRIDSLAENMELRIENVHAKVETVSSDLSEVKENVKTLFVKYDNLKDSLHEVDKDSAVSLARTAERTAENSQSREWWMRGLIAFLFSALAALLALWKKGS